MTAVPSYTKILTLGAAGTERALVGDVLVQEKCDGSQFSFGIDERGEVSCRSHHQQLVMDGPCGDFTPAVEQVRRMTPRLKAMDKPIWFYCEYLRKPKQNTLCYERTPTNHLVLFDCVYESAGTVTWADYDSLDASAKHLGIDVIPLLHQGAITRDELTALLERDSYLGGQKVEGVVVKNYRELIALGGRTFPLFAKLVSGRFKERHDVEWKQQTSKGKLELYMDSFRSVPRWQKAVQHLSEAGQLLRDPKDIGALMRAVHEDLDTEETETIKNELYALYIKDIKRVATAGLPEWYKTQLVEGLE
uniref:Putative RNA ligase n=1 Tax=viral metagenome TaxID=1070528 RepID=A0A6M3JI18_9ZZZZ